MLLLGLEIVVALTLLVVWVVRLVRRGRALAEIKNRRRCDGPEEVGERTPMNRREMTDRRLTRGISTLSYREDEDKVADDHLLYLAKLDLEEQIRANVLARYNIGGLSI